MLRVGRDHGVPGNGVSVRHFIEQDAGVVKRDERIRMEKTGGDVEMGIEAQFEEMGVEVAKELKVPQTGAGLDGGEYGEAVETSRLAMEKRVIL